MRHRAHAAPLIGVNDCGYAHRSYFPVGGTPLAVEVSASKVFFTSIPDIDWNGAETITFTATDPGSLSDSDQATFTVTGVNDAPVVSDIPDQSVAEDNPI